MDKLTALQYCLSKENISLKTAKITESQFVSALLLDDMKSLGYSAQGLSKLLSRLFPDRPKTNNKVSKWLLNKYNLAHCNSCDTVKPLDEIANNGYCKLCSNKLSAVTSVERSALYRARKLERTPVWADLEKIKDIYRNCPEGFQVDHEVPLNGTNVCGLHVEYNLQYLTPEDNKRKANKLL